MSNSACSSNINDCAEANLDVQYLMAISQLTPTTFYYWGTSSDMWLGFLLDLASRQGSSTTPLVISISYGGPESQFSSVYLHSFRIEALKLAAQGITIVAASGDDGVNCAAGLCSTSVQCGYYPQFPASSPLVTAVGATQVDYDTEETTLITTSNIYMIIYRALRATTRRWLARAIPGG